MRNFNWKSCIEQVWSFDCEVQRNSHRLQPHRAARRRLTTVADGLYIYTRCSFNHLSFLSPAELKSFLLFCFLSGCSFCLSAAEVKKHCVPCCDEYILSLLWCTKNKISLTDFPLGWRTRVTFSIVNIATFYVSANGLSERFTYHWRHLWHLPTFSSNMLFTCQ